MRENRLSGLVGGAGSCIPAPTPIQRRTAPDFDHTPFSANSVEYFTPQYSASLPCPCRMGITFPRS